MNFTRMPSVWTGISKGERKKKRENDPEARARDREEHVIVVTKATACCPIRKGGAWRKVRRLRYNQLNQL